METIYIIQIERSDYKHGDSYEFVHKKFFESYDGALAAIANDIMQKQKDYEGHAVRVSFHKVSIDDEIVYRYRVIELSR